MKVIIAGSRNVNDRALVDLAVDLAKFEIDEVVCGECRGVDLFGREWAEARDIPVASFPANWERHGKAAGPLRNREMAQYGDALILIWNPDVSRGSASMMREARAAEIPIKEYTIKYLERMLEDIASAQEEFNDEG